MLESDVQTEGIKDIDVTVDVVVFGNLEGKHGGRITFTAAEFKAAGFDISKLGRLFKTKAVSSS